MDRCRHSLQPYLGRRERDGRLLVALGQILPRVLFAQVQFLRCFTAEAEYLADERPGSHAGLLYLFQGTMDGLIRRPDEEGQFSVAQDNTQNVIKIMRNPASKCAKRFHLLRLPELLLQVPFLRDVAVRSLYANHLVAVVDAPTGRADPADRASFGHHAILTRLQMAREEVLESLEYALPIFLIDVVGKHMANELCRCIAALGFDRGTEIGENPLGIRGINHIIDLFDQMMIALLGSP